MTGSQRETREAAFAIIKDQRRLRAEGHGRAVDWARAYLDAEPPGMVIILTAEEMELAADRAARIIAENAGRAWSTKYRLKGESQLSVDTRGVAYELAGARATGLPWHDTYLAGGYRRSRKQPDLGRRTEVRGTAAPDGTLKAYDNDPLSRLFLHVVGRPPRVICTGWLEGYELKTSRYAVDGKPWTHEAPIGDLHPLPLPEDA